MTWKDRVIQSFAKQPEEWRSLGSVFDDVVNDIPLHIACRSAMKKKRRDLRWRDRDDSHLQWSDIDVPIAQWRLFNSFVLHIVERQTHFRFAQRDSMVRLKPAAACEECGHATYRQTWEKRQYFCPRCAKARLVIGQRARDCSSIEPKSE